MKRSILTAILLCSFAAATSSSAEEEPAKKGLFRKIFGISAKGGKAAEATTPAEEATEEVDAPAVDVAEAPIIEEPVVNTAEYSAASVQVPLEESDIRLKTSRSEQAVDDKIFSLQQEFDERLSQFDDPELSVSFLREMGDVPQNFESAWFQAIRKGLWAGENVKQPIEKVYAAALEHSYQVADLTFNPLIQETNIGVSEAQFNLEGFTNVEGGHLDEPTGTTLATGTTGRLEEDEISATAGVRKRLKTGTEVELSNDIQTLENNSTFLDPNPQSQSEISLRVIQPLLRGRGVDYNTISIKIATLDSRIAAEELISALESHLLEVNRAYWAVYLARAAYAQRVDLVERTRKIVSLLEDREEIDSEATASEIVRARAALVERRADLIRSKTAIRTSEERLRFLVNDPDLPMGDKRELIPSTRPVLSAPSEDIRKVAQAALANRAEVSRALNTIRVAGLRKDSSKNDLLPQLNLSGEVGYAGLGNGRVVGRAYDDLTDHGTTWRVGLNYSQTLERDFAKSFTRRRQLEYRQAVNQARLAADSVILTVLVSYREMATSYRDMQAKYQAVKASREEVRKLQELVDIDAGEDAGRTVGYRLQLLLDAIERNQSAEEEFLVSVVGYNFSLAFMERAKGTFLQMNDVNIERVESGTWRTPDTLRVTKQEPMPMPVTK